VTTAVLSWRTWLVRDGVPDAEVAGCVVEAGLAGEGEGPLDAACWGEGFQAEELLGGAVVCCAGDRDGEHDGERGPVAEEVEALGGHQAQRPAGPH
jgi:hypothetical protein